MVVLSDSIDLNLCNYYSYWLLFPWIKFGIIINNFTKCYKQETDYIYEAVYNKDGILLTENNSPINMDTYNYCSD